MKMYYRYKAGRNSLTYMVIANWRKDWKYKDLRMKLNVIPERRFILAEILCID